MVAEGTFREDLYFRLAQVTLELPSLRERGPDDIMHLAHSFLSDIIERDGISITLGTNAIEALKRHSWRGNVRELRGVLERATMFCEGSVIKTSDLWLEDYASQVTRLDEVLRSNSLEDVHQEVDTILLRRVLKETRGNISHAARKLGIDRGTLSRRLKELGIEGIGRDDDA